MVGGPPPGVGGRGRGPLRAGAGRALAGYHPPPVRERWLMTGPLHRPYPPDRYRGTTGEVSARLRAGHGEPEVRFRTGVSCEYLATGDQTGATFGLYRWTFGEDGSGPEPHFHRAITESFYVLSGEVQLYDGEGWKTGRT